MLAEIFFLRLESMARASEDAARAQNARFVPLSREVAAGPGEARGAENAKSI